MEKYPTVSQQHQQHQNNSSFELIEDSTDYSTVIPAEALLGISPTSNEAAGRFSCSSVDPFSKKSGPTKLRKCFFSIKVNEGLPNWLLFNFGPSYSKALPILFHHSILLSTFLTTYRADPIKKQRSVILHYIPSCNFTLDSKVKLLNTNLIGSWILR